MPNPAFILLLPALSLAAALGMGVTLLRARRAWASEAARKQETQARALDFHRQTLRAVTGGRLRLCEPDEVPALLRGERLWSLPLLEEADVSQFRRHLRAIAARRGFSDGRLDDLCSCVSEAAANAVRHSGGGVAQVWAADGGLTILVSDCGAGLAPDALLHSSLGEGQDGANSLDGGLGMGFRLMLALADTVALCTGAEGTQLVLTVCSRGAGEERGNEDGRMERAA
jgi:anti-sigma regulatory factor (Ser/Thr protein kinase)